MAVKVGDTAPDFTLPAQNGATVSLSAFRGQKAVVLYFYPKDDTPPNLALSATSMKYLKMLVLK
jgi:peroxiredoxin